MKAVDWSRTLNVDLDPRLKLDLDGDGDTVITDDTLLPYGLAAASLGYSGIVIDGGYYPVDEGGNVTRLRREVVVDLPRSVVDHENRQMTVSVTFDWNPPWALDKCEAGVIVGETRRALVTHFGDYDQLAGIADVSCWEPDEERHLGRYQGARFPVPFDRSES